MDNVIPFRLDPAYFFDRAVRYLDRHDPGRALKYFRRAVEYEPDNSANHCNLAGVLSELGQYEESNEMLLYVLDKLDADMSECNFYIANNYANLGQYDLAEEYALRYLEAEPEGEFSEDAIDMMDVLVKEFGGGEVLREREEQYKREVEKRDYARKLLEVGKFSEAIEQLEMEIQENPNDLAPRNNLALAYYYMGQVDKALAAVDDVLGHDPSNIHARCNLAVFFQHLGDEESLRAILEGLRKLHPIGPDHLFKLATTMGILDEHRIAHRLFRSLIKFGSADVSVKHAYAASAANIGNIKLARRLWHDIVQEDPEAGVADFYLNRLDICEETRSPFPIIGYQYHIPFHEQFRALKEYLETNSSSALRFNAVIRSSMFRALATGDLETKIQVIQTMALMPDAEVITALREFVRSPDEIDQLKRLALFVLSKLSAKEASDAVFNDRDVVMWLRSSRSAGIEREWLQVADKCVEKMKQRYDETVCESARRTWTEFIRALPDRPMRMGRWQSWAAGLEYVVLQTLNIPVRQIDLATVYGVSVGMVSKRARSIRDGHPWTE